MGLDMYLNGRVSMRESRDGEPRRAIDGCPVSAVEVEIAYWRKHPNLHGYIVQTFADGEDNCRPVFLLLGDIQKIIRAVKNDNLPHTEGFFFGTSSKDDEQRAEDVALLEKAAAWLKAEASDERRAVYYLASW